MNWVCYKNSMKHQESSSEMGLKQKLETDSPKYNKIYVKTAIIAAW